MKVKIIKNQVKIIFINISILFFLVATFQECYIANGMETIGSIGFAALLFGWMNASLSFIVWFANPFYFLSIILISKNKKAAKITTSTSLLLALSFLILDKVVINEGGTIEKVEAYLFGYWLWVASIFLLFLTAFFITKPSVNT